MRSHRLVLLLLCALQLPLAAPILAGVPANADVIVGASSSDIYVIRNRYILSVLPTDPAQISHLHELSSQYANSLEVDGQWSDIQYQSSGRAAWNASEHLDRTLVMAKMARILGNEGRPDASLNAKTIRALQAWTDHDFRNANWWWNEIGVPELTGEIATLMLPEMPEAELTKVVDIMKRSNWWKGPWTGANLTWGVVIEIVRGCLENDVATVTAGYDRMYQEIKIVSPTEEGIQQDDSFHQHGAQFYSGEYGLNYADDVGRFVAFAWGTPLQIPADKMAIFSSYLLDGEQWMVRGEVLDYSAIGRGITRAGAVATPRDWTVGPISPAGPAYSLGNVISMLSAEPTPRQKEFQTFAARLQEKRDAQNFSGNKQFWCSDFMAHRRKSFYTSVKMLSSRIQNAEVTNGEGWKSEHLSDGANFLYLTGDEYKDIFPVWDWTKIPGTTAIQGTLDTGERNPISTRGATSFAGGVSDGTYGMAAMDLSRGNLVARKAWFFFDDGYLCLGAGVTLNHDADHGVATDVNQTLLHGIVLSSQSKDPIPDGTYAYTAGITAWVYHDHVGYIFAPGSKVKFSVSAQTGKWSDIGSGSNQSVTIRVFDLWIDHGRSPDHGTYQYYVLPEASLEETEERASTPTIQVLANNDDVQAARNGRIGITMIAFRQPGSLATPEGRVSVDHSCLLLIRKISGGWRISASNPENLPLTLHVRIVSHVVKMDLPGGNFAGSSVTSTIRADSATVFHSTRPVTRSAR